MNRVEKFKDYRKQLQTSLTANEMFEEIGYKLVKTDYQDNDNYVRYERTNGWYVEFCKSEKLIDVGGSDDCYGTIMFIELKAINQQCKELGWLESENK